MTKTSTFRRALLVGLAALCATVAQAQSFAGKPIRILVGYAPGGGADLIARVYGEKLQELLGTTVIVENRTGAFEQLAALPVASAAPDGHTLWLGTAGAMTMGPGVRSNLPYDILNTYTHVAKVGEVEAVFAVRKDLPVKTLPEFLAYLRQNPGKLNYASAGVGSGNHLLSEYLLGIAQGSMTHIPYKGDSDVVRELAAGTIDFGIPTVASGSSFVRDGRFKALAVTGSQRSKALPDVPSLAESGGVDALRGYGTYSIYALLGPAGMPPAVTRALNEAVAKVAAMPDVVQKLEAANLRAATATPAELRRYIEQEVAKWREVGKNLKLD